MSNTTLLYNHCLTYTVYHKRVGPFSHMLNYVLASHMFICHTAIINKYIVEGVPNGDVWKSVNNDQFSSRVLF